MSQEELTELEAAERELEEKMRALRTRKRELQQQEEQRKLEEKEKKLMERDIIVEVEKIYGSMVICKSNYRPDLIELWKSIPGRVFKGYAGYGNEKETPAKNGIPVSEWKDTQEKLKELPRVEIKIAASVSEHLEWMLNAPPVEVDFDPRKDRFEITPGPDIRISLYGLPGAEVATNFHGTSVWSVPKNEGWRIPEYLESTDGVVYNDIAKEMILLQVESRNELDGIAMQEDSDFEKLELLDRIIFNPRTRKQEPFKDALMAHQRVMIEFMYKAGGRVINADDTGLGKTWEFLGYSEILRAERESEGEDFQALVIVKPANIPQWTREIKNLTGETPFICKTGSPDTFDLGHIVTKKPKYVLISYDTMGAYKVIKDGMEISKKQSREGAKLIYPWVSIFNTTSFTIVGMDEVTQIKNPSAYRTKAAFSLDPIENVIPMTATPILNRAEELSPILRLVRPNLFESHEQFLRNYTINDGRQVRNPKQLHKMMRTFFLMRKKEEVLGSFPEINRIQRFYELSQDAYIAYKEAERGLYTSLVEFDPSGTGGEQMHIMSELALITRCLQICAADKAKNYTPMLAQEIADEANGEIGKKKILIFSKFKGTAWNIANRLGDEAVCTVKNTGDKFHSINSTERDELFERIRHNDNIKYLVTTAAAKEGHNLEFCWWTIFNDPWWSPMSHYQAESRCIRVTNPHPIDSFYVQAEAGVEEAIYELLSEKLAIIEETVDGVEESRAVLGSIGSELIKRLRERMWQKD